MTAKSLLKLLPLTRRGGEQRRREHGKVSISVGGSGVHIIRYNLTAQTHVNQLALWRRFI